MSVKGKKIVIAEDDNFIAEMYIAKLLSEGFEVEHAQDGQEAIEKICKVQPDIVLLDILMPKLDGIEVLKRIRADKKVKNTTVIILTNANEKDHISKAMEMGANDYLIKSSFTPDEIVSKIKENI